jgi:hypothetical protein
MDTEDSHPEGVAAAYHGGLAMREGAVADWEGQPRVALPTWPEDIPRPPDVQSAGMASLPTLAQGCSLG